MGSYPGYLSWFQVSLISAEKCGSCGGRNFGLPIDLSHRLYNSLLHPCRFGRNSQCEFCWLSSDSSNLLFPWKDRSFCIRLMACNVNWGHTSVHRKLHLNSVRRLYQDAREWQASRWMTDKSKDHAVVYNVLCRNRRRTHANVRLLFKRDRECWLNCDL